MTNVIKNRIFELKELAIKRADLQDAIKSFGTLPNHDLWSFNDVQAAVDEAKTSWEKKKRVGGGKVQKTYHDIVCGLEAHSTLFEFIPSSNTYVSIAAGAVQCLVHASKTHRDTVEQLTRALKEINDEAQACVSECKVIRSRDMQLAIAKFYINVFVFYAEAIKWYQSRSYTKVLSSFNANFLEQFRDKLEDLKRLSKLVQRAASTGAMAEVRASRLQNQYYHEQLVAEGARRASLRQVELEDEERRHRDVAGHLQKLMEGPIADALCEKVSQSLWRKVGLEGSTVLLEDCRKQHYLAIEDENKAASPRTCDPDSNENLLVTTPHFHEDSTTPSDLTQSDFNVSQVLRILEDIIPSLSSHRTMMTNIDFSGYQLLDQQVVMSLDNLIKAKGSLTLYVEGPFDSRVPTQSTTAAAKFAESVNDASVPLLSFFCSEATNAEANVTAAREAKAIRYSTHPLQTFTLSLVYQVLANLPPLQPVSDQVYLAAVSALNSDPTVFSQALDFLRMTLELSPALVFCIIDSFGEFDDEESSQVLEVLKALRNATQVPDKVFKILFTSATRVPILFKELSDEEVELIEGSTLRKGRSAF